MITKAILPLLSAAGYASAYYSEVSNANLEFAASESGDSSPLTVDSNSLKHHPSHLKALEDALELHPPSLGFSAPLILDLFEGWMAAFERKYETAEERSKRLLTFLDNHGAYMSCALIFNFVRKAALTTSNS